MLEEWVPAAREVHVPQPRTDVALSVEEDLPRPSREGKEGPQASREGEEGPQASREGEEGPQASREGEEVPHVSPEEEVPHVSPEEEVPHAREEDLHRASSEEEEGPQGLVWEEEYARQQGRYFHLQPRLPKTPPPTRAVAEGGSPRAM